MMLRFINSLIFIPLYHKKKKISNISVDTDYSDAACDRFYIFSMEFNMLFNINLTIVKKQ